MATLPECLCWVCGSAVPSAFKPGRIDCTDWLAAAVFGWQPELGKATPCSRFSFVGLTYVTMGTSFDPFKRPALEAMQRTEMERRLARPFFHLMEAAMSESTGTDLMAVMSSMMEETKTLHDTLSAAAEKGQQKLAQQLAEVAYHKAMGSLLTQPVVDDIWEQLEGVGFLTQHKTTYTPKQKRDLILQCQRDGVSLMGKEALMMPRGVFVCGPFYERALVHDPPEGFHLEYCEPCDVEFCTQDGQKLARVSVIAKWTMDGKQFTRAWEKDKQLGNRSFDARCVVKVDSGQGEVAVKGKARYRAMRDIWRSLINFEPVTFDESDTIDAESRPVSDATDEAGGLEEEETETNLEPDSPSPDPEAQGQLYDEFSEVISRKRTLDELVKLWEQGIENYPYLTDETKERLRAVCSKKRQQLEAEA